MLLTTPRLLLRPFTPVDAPRLVALANDYEVTRYTLNMPHPYAAADAQSWLGLTQRHYAEGTAYPFALELRATGELVGGIGLNPEPRFDRAEVGYWLGRAYWGQGLAAEALGALLYFGFKELELNKIYAMHHAENLASGQVLLKQGFVLEGKLAQHTKRDGRYYDAWQYGLLRQHYQPDGVQVTLG